MSLVTPTTKEISDNIIAQLEASLNQTIPLLPKSFLRVLAKALAGVFVLLYKYTGFMFLQIFVTSASANETIINGVSVVPLTEWGRLIGVADRVSATNAELLIDITVTNQVGTLPSGSGLVNSDNGVTYITIGDVALNAPVVQANIRAVDDEAGGGGAGAIGNLDPGATVSFASPLPNVVRNTVVVSQVVTGANAEAVSAYRQRIIDRFRRRPQGGAYADYEEWSEEVAGIINAYPYTSASPGQVDVFVEATEASSGSPDGIPTQAQLDAVADSIELDSNGLATRRPANALVNTLAITRTGFDVRITGLIVPDEVAVKASITSAVEDYFLALEPFIPGLGGVRNDRVTATAVVGVVSGIVSIAGGVFTTAAVTLLAANVEIYTLGIGEKAKAATVVYV